VKRATDKADGQADIKDRALGEWSSKAITMDEFASSALLELIRKFLFISMCIIGVYSIYCGNRATHNLDTQRGTLHKTWFIMTTMDALFVPDYYTKKGNKFRVRALISTTVCLFLMLAFGISFLL
jgi:hypothetical protein